MRITTSQGKKWYLATLWISDHQGKRPVGLCPKPCTTRDPSPHDERRVWPSRHLDGDHVEVPGNLGNDHDNLLRLGEMIDLMCPPMGALFL